MWPEPTSFIVLSSYNIGILSKESVSVWYEKEYLLFSLFFPKIFQKLSNAFISIVLLGTGTS